MGDEWTKRAEKFDRSWNEVLPAFAAAISFTLRGVFSGPMLKLIGSIPDMSDAFREFAAGLKKRAEG